MVHQPEMPLRSIVSVLVLSVVNWKSIPICVRDFFHGSILVQLHMKVVSNTIKLDVFIIFNHFPLLKACTLQNWLV